MDIHSRQALILNHVQISYVIIGSGKWTEVDLLSIGPLWANFSVIWIEQHTFYFTKMHLKISLAKWWSFTWVVTYVVCNTLTSNEHQGVSDHRSFERLFNNLFGLTSKKYQRSALLPLCEGKPPMTGEFPSQRASNAESVSISWHHHGPRFSVPSTAMSSSTLSADVWRGPLYQASLPLKGSHRVLMES